MKFYVVWLLAVFSTCFTAHGQENPWIIGLHSGYSALGNLHAVDLNNGFPLAASLGYQIDESWNTKFEYQWIKSEHIGGDAAALHSMRILSKYQWFHTEVMNAGIESGLGYQYANLVGIDQVRMMEWLIGPAVNWKINDVWNIEAVTRYAHSFDGFLQSGLQRFEIGVGISFQFGKRTYVEKNNSFTDSDQDGVRDSSDECSTTPFGIKVGKNGCPSDGDGDLVADYNDFCPNTKQGSEVDNMGCPLLYPGRGVIDGIVFERNSPRLTDPSKNELSKIADYLKKFPDIYFVIEGYSSSVQSNTDRLTISKARAVSVMNILISYGVPSHKMKAVGLSDMYPLTESTNASDQILNERIEIKWKHQL